MGIHHWKVNLSGNGPQAFGPTVEHALTGPTPPRIQRFRMRLMRFHFKEISHVPGKKMYIADAL